MKNKELYKKAFSRLKASENTLDILEEKIMRKPVKFKKLIVIMACVVSLAVAAIAANAAAGSADRNMIVHVNGDSRTDLSITVNENGGAIIVGGAETLKPGDIVNYMDITDPNKKKGGFIKIGDFPEEQYNNFHPVTGRIQGGKYIVTKVENDGKPDVDITTKLLENGEVEITGSFKTLNYKYTAYMENGKTYLRNEKNDSVEEFYNFDTANR